MVTAVRGPRGVVGVDARRSPRVLQRYIVEGCQCLAAVRRSLSCLGLTSRVVSDGPPDRFRTSFKPPTSAYFSGPAGPPRTAGRCTRKVQYANLPMFGARRRCPHHPTTFFLIEAPTDRPPGVLLASRTPSIPYRECRLAFSAFVGIRSCMVSSPIGAERARAEQARKSRLTSCVPKPFCLGGRLGRTSEVCRIRGRYTVANPSNTVSGRAEHEMSVTEELWEAGKMRVRVGGEDEGLTFAGGWAEGWERLVAIR